MYKFYLVISHVSQDRKCHTSGKKTRSSVDEASNDSIPVKIISSHTELGELQCVLLDFFKVTRPGDISSGVYYQVLPSPSTKLATQWGHKQVTCSIQLIVREHLTTDQNQSVLVLSCNKLQTAYQMKNLTRIVILSQSLFLYFQFL